MYYELKMLNGRRTNHPVKDQLELTVLYANKGGCKKSSVIITQKFHSCPSKSSQNCCKNEEMNGIAIEEH